MGVLPSLAFTLVLQDMTLVYIDREYGKLSGFATICQITNILAIHLDCQIQSAFEIGTDMLSL